MFDKFFDYQTIPFYILGCVVFLITIIDDIFTTKKSFWQYLQDLLFTLIAIAIGISCCILCELPKAWWWIIIICCGFLGATIIHRIDDKKETITDKTIDKAFNATLNKLEKKINKEKQSEESDNIREEN